MMIGALACLSLTGCRDQNFDWENVKSENIEYQYGQLMEKIFGEIGPDHSWDNMDAPEFIMSGTRATTQQDLRNINTDKIKWEGDIYRNLDWYYVDTKMFEEGTVSTLFNETNGANNLDLGQPCVLTVPNKDFWVTIAMQGRCPSHGMDLYMDIIDGNNTTEYHLWTKDNPSGHNHNNDHIQHLAAGTTGICDQCDGSGWKRSACAECGGTGYEKCQECAGSGQVPGSVNCPTCGGDGITQSGRRYYGCTDCGGERGNGATNSNNVAKPGTGKVAGSVDCTACSGHGHTDVQCNYCNGTGDGDFVQCTNNRHAAETAWSHPDYGTGSTQGSVRVNGVTTYPNSKNIRAKKLHFVQEGADGPAIKPGASIVFRVVVTSSLNNVYSPNQTETFRTTDRKTAGNKAGSPIGILTNAKRPNNIDPRNTCYVIGCEGSLGLERRENNNVRHGEYYGDWDMNDLVVLFESREAPVVKPVDRYEITVKRYMMEDLGYDQKTTVGDNVMEESDIDFNDIVVDFYRKVHITEHYELGEKTANDDIEPVYTHAYVRALGGTMDFKFKVAGNTVFQKSTAGTTEDSYGVVINNSYFNNGFTGFDSGIMYNTAEVGSTVPHTDGKKLKNSYLAQLKDENITAWDPATNNITVEVIPEGSDGLSESDQKNVYVLEFPAVGDKHPKIISFGKLYTSPADTEIDVDLNQISNKMVEWRNERQAITLDWFNNNKGENKQW